MGVVEPLWLFFIQASCTGSAADPPNHRAQEVLLIRPRWLIYPCRHCASFVLSSVSSGVLIITRSSSRATGATSASQTRTAAQTSSSALAMRSCHLWPPSRLRSMWTVAKMGNRTRCEKAACTSCSSKSMVRGIRRRAQLRLRRISAATAERQAQPSCTGNASDYQC